MTLPTPLSLLPSCQLWVDGERFADGCTEGELPDDPVALTDLKVTWGRDNTLDQPEPGTCNFLIMDEGGGVKFTDVLHIGSQIDVKAQAVIYPDPTVPIFTYNPGFEDITAGQPSKGLNIGAGSVVSNAQALTGTRSVKMWPDGTRANAQLLFGPAPFSPVSGAWDAVPQTIQGQPWTFGLSVKATSLLGVPLSIRVRAVAFTGSSGATGTYTLLDPELRPPADGTWQTVSFTAVPPDGVWLGISVELVPAAPKWNDLYTDITWDSLGGAALQTNLATNPTPGSATNWQSNASANWTHAYNATDKCVEVTFTAAGVIAYPNMPASWYNVGLPVANPVLAAGVKYQRSLEVWVDAAATLKNVMAGGFVGNQALAAGQWTRVVEQFTGSGTAQYVMAASVQMMGATAGLHVKIRRAQLIENPGGTTLPYFDGSTPDTADTRYDWTGTANASTSTATDLRTAPRWDDLGAVYIDDLVLLAPAGGAGREAVVFSGRLTDMRASYDLDVGATVVACIAQTHLAELDNRYVGDEPWALERLVDRFSRIVTLSGQQLAWKVDTSVQGTLITWRDVDSQPSGGLLHQLAQSVGGALWSAFSESTGPYLWLEDINNRPSIWVLVRDPDNVIRIHQNTSQAALDRFLEIDSCDISLEPIEWFQTTEDDATRVVVTWQEQGVDTDGKNTVTSRDEVSNDVAAEMTTGRRRIQVTTQLANQTEAAKLSQALLARAQSPGWRVSGLEWDMVSTERLDPTRLDKVMTILDGVKRLGLGLMVVNMPTWFSPASGADLPLYLEGGVFRNIMGAWELELLTSNATAQGQSTVRWDDLPQARNATRTNPAYNPRNVAGGSGTWTGTRSFGTGGAGTYSDLTGISPSPTGNVTTARRKTWTTAPSSNAGTGLVIRQNSSLWFPVTAGQTVTVSCWVRFSGSGTRLAAMVLQVFTGTTVGGEGTVLATVSAASQTLQPNVWTRLSFTYLVPAGANSLGVFADILTGGTLWAVGNTLDGTAVIIEPATITRTNRATNPQDRTGGAAGWLTTRTFGSGGAGTHTHSQAVTAPSEAPSILTACRKTWTTASSTPDQTGLNLAATATDWFPVTAGEQITVSAFMRHSSATAKDFAVWVSFYNGTTMASAVPVGGSVGAPGIPAAPNTWTRVSYFVAVPAGAVGMRVITDVRSGAGPWAIGEWLEVTGLMIERATTIGVVGTYFDGDVADTATIGYDWAGATWNSVSTQATLPEYFDGSTTDTAEIDFAWAGTANSSTSTAKDLQGWQWDQFDPAISWNDLTGVGL